MISFSLLGSYMFAFDNHETVKKIVSYLPAVGVGPNYGIPRTRYVNIRWKSQLNHKLKNEKSEEQHCRCN